MDLTQQLRALFDAVVAEAERSPAFAARLRDALAGAASASTTRAASSGRSKSASSASTADDAPKRRGGRRPAGALDPFAAYREGEDVLRARLGELSVDQLKDIVAEHALDPSKLAMRWKTPGRLIDLIVQTAGERLEKGNALR
jgi:hypothetical protein